MPDARDDIPPQLDTDALPVLALDSASGQKIPRRRVFSWALWDWATQPFATVITTFVFTVYLTSELFLDPDVRALGEGNALYDEASQPSPEISASALPSPDSLSPWSPPCWGSAPTAPAGARDG